MEDKEINKLVVAPEKIKNILSLYKEGSIDEDESYNMLEEWFSIKHAETLWGEREDGK